MINRKLTSAFLKRAGDYILVRTPLAKADIGIVFGNAHADHLAAEAASLYKAGFFTRLIVSGGVATDDGRLEAHRMRDDLVKLGVPASAILVEDKSRNTGENVVNCMALLQARGELAGIGSILAVGHIHASRRFLMTLERHWPEPAKMFAATASCYKAPRERWQEDPEFKAAVLAEYAKIAPYKAQGFITEINLARNSAKIARLPRPQWLSHGECAI